MSSHSAPHLQFVFKVSARCNLDCTYCYVFNKADQSWKSRSAVMSDTVFEAAISRVRRHCIASGQNVVRLMFHGGEPLLIGTRRFRRWLEQIDHELKDIVKVRLAIQTNATLIDDDWAHLFAENGVEVGVSLDGPQAVNDRFRIDHFGYGSYAKIINGIGTLRRHGADFSLLSVIQLGADGAAIYNHFRNLEPRTINFLFPDHNHDDIAQVRALHGATPIFDFLRPVIDAWALDAGEAADVPLLRNLCRLILGGESRSDMFGNAALGFVFVEVDGDIEGLDVLRLDGEGMAACGANVLTNDFSSIAQLSDFHDRAIFRGLPLPNGCAVCPERQTCAGGYLPHRYSLARGFDNPSAWCADILLLFDYLRQLLDVDVAETRLRRDLLVEIAQGQRE
jgi:uncharacterized protein